MEYRKKNRKFTDVQFLELYNRGLNDPQIAEIFNVAKTSVMYRRWKLGLMPQKTTYLSNPQYNCNHRYEVMMPYNRKWRQNNHEKYKRINQETLREYRKENPEKVKALNKAYKEKNRERINQKRKELRHRKGINKTYRKPYIKSKT